MYLLDEQIFWPDKPRAEEKNSTQYDVQQSLPYKTQRQINMNRAQI